MWIKTTRAWNLFKGLIIILLFVLVAALFQMDTILWLAEKLFNIGLVALVVIFSLSFEMPWRILVERPFG